MTTINLQATRSDRVEWVQSYIMGLFDLPHRPENYNSPEKWEDTITLLMGTGTRDYDAKKLHPNSTKHAAKALNNLKESNILNRLTTPLTEVSHTLFAREMANLIVKAADTIDTTIINQTEEEPKQDTTHRNTNLATAALFTIGLAIIFILVVAVGISN